MVAFAVAAALWALATLSILELLAARRHRRALIEVLEVVGARDPDGAGTDPELLERLEATERRVTMALEDLDKKQRKLAQERRRLERHLDDDDDEGPSRAELDALRRALLEQDGREAPADPHQRGRMVRAPRFNGGR